MKTKIEDATPAKGWSVSSLICASLCIVVTLAVGVFALVYRADWHGLAGLGLVVLVFNLLIAFLVVSVLGTICSILAAVRHEFRKLLVAGLLLNLGILICAGLSLFFVFVLPFQRGEQLREQRRAHYLATRTPEQHLFDAIRQKTLEEVRELLEEGVDSNATDRGGTRALHRAAIYSTPEILECLIDHGATDDKERPVALHLAASSGNIEMLKILVAKGWNPNLRIDYLKNGTMVSPLDRAISATKTGRNREAEIHYLISLSDSGTNGAEQSDDANPGHAVRD